MAVLAQVNRPAQRKATTAQSQLEREEARTAISTFSQNVDSLFGTGIPRTKVTEVCGAPGIGKTQIGIQLAINVQIPVECGGVGGEAVYLGAFPVALMTTLEAAIHRIPQTQRAASSWTALLRSPMALSKS